MTITIKFDVKNCQETIKALKDAANISKKALDTAAKNYIKAGYTDLVDRYRTGRSVGYPSRGTIAKRITGKTQGVTPPIPSYPGLPALYRSHALAEAIRHRKWGPLHYIIDIDSSKRIGAQGQDLRKVAYGLEYGMPARELGPVTNIMLSYILIIYGVIAPGTSSKLRERRILNMPPFAIGRTPPRPHWRNTVTEMEKNFSTQFAQIYYNEIRKALKRATRNSK